MSTVVSANLGHPRAHMILLNAGVAAMSLEVAKSSKLVSDSLVQKMDTAHDVPEERSHSEYIYIYIYIVCASTESV